MPLAWFRREREKRKNRRKRQRRSGNERRELERESKRKKKRRTEKKQNGRESREKRRASAGKVSVSELAYALQRIRQNTSVTTKERKQNVPGWVCLECKVLP